MATNLFDLTGRTALISGSTRGLGRAIAEGLGGAGAALVIKGCNADASNQTTAELREAGFDARAASFDVTHEAAVTEAFSALDTEGIAIDILQGYSTGSRW